MPVPEAYVADFSGTEGSSVQLVPSADVPPLVWRRLLGIDHDALVARLPQNQGYRAAQILGTNQEGGTQRYIHLRTNPDAVVDEPGWNDNQRFFGPEAALIYVEDELSGAVLTDINISYGRSPAEVALKRLVPAFGYVHIRDVILNDRLTPRRSGTYGAIPVSGLTIGALYHSLSHRNRFRKASAYYRQYALDEPDPADAPVAHLAGLLGMHDTGTEIKGHIPGYAPNITQVRNVLPIREMLRTIRALPGAAAALQSMTVRSP